MHFNFIVIKPIQGLYSVMKQATFLVQDKDSRQRTDNKCIDSGYKIRAMNSDIPQTKM